MKVSTENDNNFWYEKITILVDNIPLRLILILDMQLNRGFFFKESFYLTLSEDLFSLIE